MYKIKSTCKDNFSIIQTIKGFLRYFITKQGFIFLQGNQQNNEHCQIWRGGEWQQKVVGKDQKSAAGLGRSEHHEQDTEGNKQNEHRQQELIQTEAGQDKRTGER